MRGRNKVSSRDGETSKLRLRRRAGWEEEVGFATSVAPDAVREEVVGGDGDCELDNWVVATKDGE